MSNTFWGVKQRIKRILLPSTLSAKTLRKRAPPPFFTPESSLTNNRDSQHFRSLLRALRSESSINWKEDPHSDRTWSFQLHTLKALWPLFQRYEDKSCLKSLSICIAIIVNWIDKNPRHSKNISPFAWYDMAVGYRAPLLTYALTSGIKEGVISLDSFQALTNGIRSHAEYLIDDRNYAFSHNHGLFEDAGLWVMADHLKGHWFARAWKIIALRRMRDTLSRTVECNEGIHLEHSFAYHGMIADLLYQLEHKTSCNDSLVVELVEKMSENIKFLVTPDGKYAQVGDTDRIPPPRWENPQPVTRTISKLFGAAGYAMVRSARSHFVVCAGYHNHAHKHIDDTSFCLFEDGRRLLEDPGRYGYYYDQEERRYATSNAGHNVLVIDGKILDERHLNELNPYGSALDSMYESDGIYLVKCSNPWLNLQGTKYTRWLIYLPETFLLVIDNIECDQARELKRIFHFAEQFDVQQLGENSWTVSRDGYSFTIEDWTSGHAEKSIVKIENSFLFPSNRIALDTKCLAIKTHSQNTILRTLFRFSKGNDVELTNVDDSGFLLQHGTNHWSINLNPRHPVSIVRMGAGAS